MATHSDRSRPSTRSNTTEVDSADAVLVASRALVGVAARSLATTEDTVTLVQYRALVLLGSRGEMNVGSLADALDIHQSTATRLCDRLVAKGLVARTASTESRREVFVALTPSGHTLIRSVTKRRRREIDTILTRLSPNQRALLLDAFTTFAEAAGEVPDEAWKLGWTV
jgi:DNA-binding MarR family transcriptional regulator